jgi:hypothetical protein
MNRRKFLIGTGSLAAGSAAAMGTGAFTSVSANRTVNIDLADDSSAFLKLEPGNSGLISDTEQGTLEIDITDTEAGGQGANMNAVTTIGDPNNPEDEHAYKVVNQGTQSVMFKQNYYFTETDWIEGNGNGQSHINFEVLANSSESFAADFPAQGPNRDSSVGNPEGSSFGSNSGGFRFNVGEEYYVVITIDTTGANASQDDKLGGTAVIEADTETSDDIWEPKNPPSL